MHVLMKSGTPLKAFKGNISSAKNGRASVTKSAELGPCRRRSATWGALILLTTLTGVDRSGSDCCYENRTSTFDETKEKKFELKQNIYL